MGRKHLLVAAQTVISVTLMVLLFRRLDINAFAALFRRLPFWFYVASLAVIVGGQMLYAWRWRLLLVCNGVSVGFRAVVRQYFIGIFLNNFFPSTVGGDLAKIYYLGRDHGYRTVAASVVLDRLLGLGLLAMIASIALWVGPLRSPAILAARTVVSAVAVAVLLTLTIAVRGTGGLARRLERFGPRFIALATRLQRFRLDMAVAAARPVILGKAFGVIVSYFAAVTVIYQIFIRLSVATMPPFLPLLTVVTTVAVLSNLPVSLNGLGLREQLHVILLMPLGVSREQAVAISLLLYGHLLIASVWGLVLWARQPSLPGDVRERVAV